MGKYKVVTIIGDKNFTEEIASSRAKLTTEECIVITPENVSTRYATFVYEKEKSNILKGLDAFKQMLDEMTYQCIDMSDEVFVVNVGNLIDERTKKFIKYAEDKNIKVSYFQSPEEEPDYAMLYPNEVECIVAESANRNIPEPKRVILTKNEKQIFGSDYVEVIDGDKRIWAPKQYVEPEKK